MPCRDDPRDSGCAVQQRLETKGVKSYAFLGEEVQE